MSEPRIAYVVSRWGEPTQTFVRREAAAVEASGCRVRALSLKRPAPSSREKGSPEDVLWLGPLAVVAGVTRAIVRRPGASLRILAEVVRRSHCRNLVPQLTAACIGLAWARRGLVDDHHVHAHFGWVAATAAWSAGTFARRPYSVVLHAFEIHDRRRSDHFTPVPLRHAARVFCISRRDRSVVRTQWGVDADVLRMGVPADWVEHAASDERERDPWLIVSVGALLPKKGHAVLFDALAASDPRWNLVIVGEGPLRSDLERRIIDLGLAGRARLLGHQSETEVRTWLGKAAIACLASVETADGDRDGIPVALMEAMARGAAVVTTDVGSIGELVRGAGTLVAPDDATALAVAIDAMRDAELRRRRADEGRRRIVAEFVAERAAQPVIDLVRRAEPSLRSAS